VPRARVDPTTRVKIGEQVGIALNTAGLKFFDPDTEREPSGPDQPARASGTVTVIGETLIDLVPGRGPRKVGPASVWD